MGIRIILDSLVFGDGDGGTRRDGLLLVLSVGCCYCWCDSACNGCSEQRSRENILGYSGGGLLTQ